jgi:YHS domain-containing protein
MIRALVLPLILILLGATGFAAEGDPSKPVNDKCPVCGMAIDDTVGTSKTAVSFGEIKTEVAVAFCSDGCKKKFDANPAKYEAKVKKFIKFKGDKGEEKAK